MDPSFVAPSNVVIFGGSSDIARAVTKKLCVAGTHTVVLAGRNQTLLDEAAREAEEYGATRTDTVLFDAEEPERAAATVRASFERAGRVDLVIMAVGLLDRQEECENDAARAARMMTVNLTWPVAALTEVRRLLVNQHGGRVLVMSSAAAVRVRRSTYLYSGAKAGLDRLCEGLAHSLEDTGVTLQLLRPGVVRTKMTAGQAEPPFTTGPNEVAENVLRGLRGNRLVIWSPPILGPIFLVIRHFPTRLWRRVAGG